MHDLAGCRAILPSMEDVTPRFIAMRANSAHELFREYPYILEAKAGGKNLASSRIFELHYRVRNI